YRRRDAEPRSRCRRGRAGRAPRAPRPAGAADAARLPLDLPAQRAVDVDGRRARRARLMLAPFVDAPWLSAHFDEVVVCDVRWYLDGRSGRAAYDAGHLPGAVFVDLDADLSAHDGDGGGRHPLPAPEAFAAAMSALGVGDRDTVV